MQRASSNTSVSPNDKAIDNIATRKQLRGSRTIDMLLTVIPLASALLFVDPVLPSAEAHPRSNRSSHWHGYPIATNPLTKWRVRNVVSIGGGFKQVFWEYLVFWFCQPDVMVVP